MTGSRFSFKPTIRALQDAIFRCGGVFVIAMAYAGTANSGAIERLLNMAVTDVSDEVRRYAIAFLGFLTFKKPKYCIDLVCTSVTHENQDPAFGPGPWICFISWCLFISGQGDASPVEHW